MWLFKNGYPELSALSRSIRGSEDAFDFLMKFHPRLAALDAAIDQNANATAWLKQQNFHFDVLFASACHGNKEARAWLVKQKQELFLRLAEKIYFYRENQYFDYHKKNF